MADQTVTLPIADPAEGYVPYEVNVRVLGADGRAAKLKRLFDGLAAAVPAPTLADGGTVTSHERALLWVLDQIT